MNKLKGTILTLLSAAIFGSTAILCKFATAHGSNYGMLTLTRNLFALPFLWVIVKKSGVGFHLTKEQIKHLIILCIFGSLSTTILLYASYNFIPVGIATTLHFTYPAIVCAVSILFFKDRASRGKITSIVLSTLGIWMFFTGEVPEKGIYGIILALASGCTYSFYFLYMSKTKLSHIYTYKLSFYVCLVNSILMFGYAEFMDLLTLEMDWQAWVIQLIISLSISILGISFLQIGIEVVGPSNAAIFSLFEPISGIILGILVLNEPFGFKTILGCTLVILAVAVLSKEERNVAD